MKRISPFSLLGVAAVLAMTGCAKQQAVSYRVWYTPVPADSAGENSALKLYLEAATEAASLAPDSLSRSNFTPGDRAALLKTLSSVLQKIERGSRRECSFTASVPRLSAEEARNQGWLLIGRVLSWRVDQACQQEDWSRAIDWTLVAYKFGVDLSQAGHEEASLGFFIAGESRKVLAPHLAKLSPAQLDRLATGVAKGVVGSSKRLKAIQAEGQQMMYYVQWIQDSYRKRDWAGLDQAMYRDGREGIDYLKGLESEAAPKYFEGMADEAETITKGLLLDAEMRVPARTKVDWDKVPDRPWKRFSKHFFRFAETLVSIGDEFDARTRLFILNARILSIQKKQGSAPAKLPGEDWQKADPYSKGDFVYRATGSDFVIYSVGQDLRDDGGDTDEAGLRPDLKLDDGLY
mgnify:CR=1 FL=1